MQIAIVGNGVIGQAIAYNLLKNPKFKGSLTIIGKIDRVGSATKAAAAMLNSFAEIEKNSLNSEFDKYRFTLSRSATRMWPVFAKNILEDSQFKTFSLIDEHQPFDKGTYVINNAAADDLDDENFEAILAALLEYNEPHSLISPSEIPNYQPEQRFRALRALRIENEGWMNPKMVLEALDKILRLSARVNIVESQARKIVSRNNLVTGIECESGQVIEADQFLIANGASITQLLNESDLGLPIQKIFHGIGVSIEINVKDHMHTNCIRTPNRGLACGVYTAPHEVDFENRIGKILIGATNFISPVPINNPRVNDVQTLLNSATQQVNANFYKSELVNINVGWRPTSQDTQPILGGTSISNLFIAGGTKRDGFHLAPIISEKMTSLILGENVEDEFKWFSPERMPLKLMSRSEAIDKSLKHQISAAYQHGFVPSNAKFSNSVRIGILNDLEKLHDQVGALDWGIPPEMLDMYRYGHAK